MAQTLGSVAVGSIVKLNESGSPVEYLVVQQGKPGSMYDDSCDGTWLMRRYGDSDYNQKWNAREDLNTYADSSVNVWLNSTMLSMYDDVIQDNVIEAKIPYCVGGGSATIKSGADGLPCKVFLPSGRELGNTIADDNPQDGMLLDYFNNGTGLTARQLRNIGVSYHTRSPDPSRTGHMWQVNGDGNFVTTSVDEIDFPRPTLILPKYLWLDDTGNISNHLHISALTVPSIVMQGQGIPISWSQADGADGYILERKADSGAWTQVYSGANLSYADTAGSWSTVQYRVKAGVDGTYGDYTTSAAVKVAAASALVISGQDGSLGTVTADIPYTVSTDTGSQISLVQTVNGAQMYSGQVTSGAARSIPVMELPSGNGTIVLTATVQTGSGPVSAARTWTYNKTPISFPASGGVAQLTKSGANLLPKTLAEAVRTNPFWGGSLDKALDKLTRAVTYAGEQVPRYQEVTVNLPAAQEGDIVQLPEGGKLVEFYVAKHDYESGLNGPGRTLLVRKDCYDNRVWDNGNVNAYASSDLDSWFNSTYKNMLDADIRSLIGTTKIRYTPGNGNWTVDTLGRAVFALSATELGQSASWFNVEGSALPIANTLKVAYLNGNTNNQWTRSPRTDDTDEAVILSSGGNVSYYSCDKSHGSRPCFTLPSTFTATYYVDGNGALYDAQEYDQAGDFYDLLGNVVPSVKIATGSYVGTGTSGNAHPNSLTLPFIPKVVIVNTTRRTDGQYTPAYRFGVFFCYGLDSEYNSLGGAWMYVNNNTVAGSLNENYAKLVGTTLSWYTKASGAASQLNGSYQYDYLAIG